MGLLKSIVSTGALKKFLFRLAGLSGSLFTVTVAYRAREQQFQRWASYVGAVVKITHIAVSMHWAEPLGRAGCEREGDGGVENKRE